MQFTTLVFTRGKRGNGFCKKYLVNGRSINSVVRSVFKVPYDVSRALAWLNLWHTSLSHSFSLPPPSFRHFNNYMLSSLFLPRSLKHCCPRITESICAQRLQSNYSLSSSCVHVDCRLAVYRAQLVLKCVFSYISISGLSPTSETSSSQFHFIPNLTSDSL